ncbi:MAG: sarcosine oxidase subunit gamma family protein, partial [Pseudomonadota bacterium]
ASRNLLATGMPLDLHDSVFPAGSCTRTLFAKAEIVIARPAVAPSFAITVNRSFADYLFGLWKDAMPMIRPPGQTSHRDGTATLGHSLRSASSS